MSIDLTTEDGLRTYLKLNGWKDKINVSLLSGGTANYVYRVRDGDNATRIFKHAAPYLHSNKNFAFDPTRMDYEARILQTLSPVQSNILSPNQLFASAVHAVRLLSYDNVQKLLCIEDGGSRNLKDSYDDLRLDMRMVGRELGSWIAALHVSSRETSLALPGQDVTLSQSKNNPIAVEIYRHSYNNLHIALSQYGHDPDLAACINEDFGSLLKLDDECVCHGDYWPGNILVDLKAGQNEATNLTIVDWELTRRGTSATDVGQFAAEAFLLDHFRGDRGLLPAFLDGYAAAREKLVSSTSFGKAWLRRMVVHWAVHVAYWPTRVEWTDIEGTKELVDLGVGVLRDVLDENWDKLFVSPLLRSSKNAYTPVLARP